MKLKLMIHDEYRAFNPNEPGFQVVLFQLHKLGGYSMHELLQTRAPQGSPVYNHIGTCSSECSPHSKAISLARICLGVHLHLP